MSFTDLMSYLLYAEVTTQKMHWKSKSFARHVALGDMYDAMVDIVDELNEIWMGKYGNDTPIPTKDWNADMSSEKLKRRWARRTSSLRVCKSTWTR